MPVIAAQVIFIGSIGIAFARTPKTASGPNPQSYINVETYSIAWSALYFWILLAVLLGSVIGVSQTEEAIPRILEQFQAEISADLGGWKSDLPDTQSLDRRQRLLYGGLYSWLPTGASGPILQQARSIFLGLALFVWALCTFTSVFITYRVPPIGFGCRSIGELSLAMIWLLSAALNHVPFTNPSQAFHFTFAKDSASMGLTLGWILYVQFGVFNRCSCYTLMGATGLALPGSAAVSRALVRGIAAEYPLEASAAVAFLLLVAPAAVALAYRRAVRVFLQRDDDASNLRRWHALRDVVERRLPRAMALARPRGALRRAWRGAGRAETGP